VPEQLDHWVVLVVAARVVGVLLPVFTRD
jgi:hypothetical protein